MCIVSSSGVQLNEALALVSLFLLAVVGAYVVYSKRSVIGLITLASSILLIACVLGVIRGLALVPLILFARALALAVGGGWLRLE